MDASKVKGAADRVVEAACFFAVLALPLYFTVLTSGYEPDKAVLLRTLAAIVAAAWIASHLLRERNAGKRGVSTIRWLATALFLVYCLATVLSIDRNVSLWGLHDRQQGLSTRAAYLVFLIAFSTHFRSRAQVSRLVTVLLAGSVPVVSYAVLQQFGYDPVPTSGSPDTLLFPVWSAFGQHVFFGSYLVLIMPLTAARLLQRWEDWSPPSFASINDTGIIRAAVTLVAMPVAYLVFLKIGVDHGSLFIVLPVLLALFVAAALALDGRVATDVARRTAPYAYAALLLLQLLSLAYSGTRAAWLGVLAGAPVFGFLAARQLNRPTVSRWIVGATAAIGLFLLVLNVPNGPLQPLRTIQGLSRIANITDSGGAEGSARGRLLIWQGVTKLAVDHPAIGNTWSGPGRTLIGYGPETMRWAFQRVFPLKLRQVDSERNVWDRAHNIYLDYVVEAGLLALILFLGLLAMFFWKAFRSLRHVDDTRAWLFIAVLAAMVGHVVDGFFGIETVVSFLFISVFFGLVAGNTEEVPDKEAVMSAPGPALLPLVALLVIGGVASLLVGDRPAWLAAIWLVCAAGAVGGAATSLTKGTDGSSRRLSRNRAGILVGVTVLAGLLALGSQLRFQTAAMADRAGSNALGQGQIPGALGYFQQAVQANRYDPQYDVDLAKPYLYLGGNRGDSSEPGYVPVASDSRTIDPNRATGLGKNQLFGLEEFALKAGLDLSPLDPDMYENLGNFYLQSKRPDLASAQFVHAEQLSPANPRYVADQALSDLDANQVPRAASHAQLAMKLDNTYWLTHCTLSRVQRRMGALAAAKQEAQLARYWVKNYSPPPSPQELDALCGL